MAQLLVRAPLVDQVIASLREQIEAGTWAVGARLPSEQALATELGIGRSTVREAVRALSHTGVLEVRQGSGTFVRAAPGAGEFTLRLQRAGAAEVYEVRRGLEVEAAALAARRRTDADLERIETALAARRAGAASGERHLLLAADLDFHRAVIDAAHNPLLSELYALASVSIARAIKDVVSDQGLTGDTAGLHDDLAHAVRRRDPDAAVAAVRRHLDGTHAALADLAGR